MPPRRSEWGPLKPHQVRLVIALERNPSATVGIRLSIVFLFRFSLFFVRPSFVIDLIKFHYYSFSLCAVGLPVVRSFSFLPFFFNSFFLFFLWLLLMKDPLPLATFRMRLRWIRRGQRSTKSIFKLKKKYLKNNPEVSLRDQSGENEPIRVAKPRPVCETQPTNQSVSHERHKMAAQGK